MRSHELFELAQKYIPGGVNSPVRAFNGVGGEPIFIKGGRGPYLIDVDDREYIDYVGSWGPLILGHTPQQVKEQVIAALSQGFGFGAPTEIEVRLAQKVCELMPSIEMVRFVNSGTEASMSAIRLARGFTKRNKIIKFSGCYHGHADSLLVASGSGSLTLGVPNSAGVSESTAQDTLIAEFNNLNEVSSLFSKYGEDIAAIIIEPIAGNMNCVLGLSSFLQGLRALCTQYGSVLIFDEVMTGFRVALGGAQAHYQIKPDLTILGKVIGGGFPVGAFGGREDIMRCIAPLGPVYQAGTLSGNPVAMTAGYATINAIATPEFFTQLTKQTLKLCEGLKSAAKSANIPLQTTALGGMFGFFFTEQKSIQSLNDVKRCDITLFKKFFHAMLKRGVYLAPSAFEAGFVSSAHSDDVIERTIFYAKECFAMLANENSLVEEVSHINSIKQQTSA